jgi:hypothetical protein
MSRSFIVDGLFRLPMLWVFSAGPPVLSQPEKVNAKMARPSAASEDLRVVFMDGIILVDLELSEFERANADRRAG